MFPFATMAEDAQRRVESALSSFVDEIEKSNLRKMQVYHVIVYPAL